MRLIIVFLMIALQAACATPETKQHAKPAEPMPAAKTEIKPGPQCWSGDAGQFFGLGQKAKVSGVDVECVATADGKSAVWQTGK